MKKFLKISLFAAFLLYIPLFAVSSFIAVPPTPLFAQECDEWGNCSGGGEYCNDSSACNNGAAGACDYSSCQTYCWDSGACNYQGSGDCEYSSCACYDHSACNFGEQATCEYSSCLCYDHGACNYGSQAACEYDSCQSTCWDSTACNYGVQAACDYESCHNSCGEQGNCMDPSAYNYGSCAPCEFKDPVCCDNNATNWIGREPNNDEYCGDTTDVCDYPSYGCTDNEALNFDAFAQQDDGSCEYNYICCDDTKANFVPMGQRVLGDKCDNSYCTDDPVQGCTDENANNFDEDAEEDDDSCLYTLVCYIEVDFNIVKDDIRYTGTAEYTVTNHVWPLPQTCSEAIEDPDFVPDIIPIIIEIVDPVYPIGVPIEQPPIIIIIDERDYCTNIEGVQETIPEGYQRYEDGSCLSDEEICELDGGYWVNGECQTTINACGDATAQGPFSSAPSINLCDIGQVTADGVAENYSTYSWTCENPENGQDYNSCDVNKRCEGYNKTWCPEAQVCVNDGEECPDGGEGGSVDWVIEQFSIRPSIVTPPDTCMLSWSTYTGENPVSCTLNGQATFNGVEIQPSNAGMPVGDGNYTLRCDYDDFYEVRSGKCTVNPDYREK